MGEPGEATARRAGLDGLVAGTCRDPHELLGVHHDGGQVVVRSFHYAARTGLTERGRDVDPELVDLADQWEARAVEAFLAGYRHVEGIEELLPASEGDRTTVLRAFELDKAVYELSYELAHRPDWVGIPVAAVRRALAHAV